jgi:hypothetical protein
MLDIKSKKEEIAKRSLLDLEEDLPKTTPYRFKKTNKLKKHVSQRLI